MTPMVKLIIFLVLLGVNVVALFVNIRRKDLHLTAWTALMSGFMIGALSVMIGSTPQ